MSRRNVVVCDVCGHKGTEAEPLSVTVTRWMPPSGGLAFPFCSQEPQAASIDLCEGCAGPLIALLRHAEARHRQAKKDPDCVPAGVAGLVSLSDLQALYQARLGENQ